MHESTHLLKSGWRQLGWASHRATKIRALGKNKGIMAFGLVAFIFDTACGVIFLKIVNIFLPKDKKINPLIGGAGISAFPMSSRVVQKVGIEADKQNHLLPFALGANVSGQIASVLAGGLLMSELIPIFG